MLLAIRAGYGTGSLLSEFGGCGHQKLFRSRALSIQKWFRRSSMWCFWNLDLAIENALFFAQAAWRKFGRALPNAPDNFSRWFGTVVPSDIHWKR